MFLHAGAGLHGHEFSGQQTSQAQPRRFPLLRSALRPLTVEFPEPKPLEVSSSSSSSSSGRRSLSDDSPQTLVPARRRQLSEVTTPRRELSVRFLDPPVDTAPSPAPTLTDDDESVAGSDRSITSSRRRRQKRLPGDSSRFALAHPAPHPRTRRGTLVQIRPRVLLQLQRLNEQRPVPAFEVVPSSIVSGSIIIPRLAKRFPRIFRAKAELGPDDILFLRSEDYNSPSVNLDPDEDHQLDNRDIIAVVSPLPERGDDGAEIVLEDGTAWATSLLSNGSYEFRSVDNQGRVTAARWVKREARPKMKSSDYMDASPSPSPAPPEYKWTFSVIDPSTRRHPILGVLTKNELEIYHTYCTLSSSSGRSPPTKSFDVARKERILRSMTPPADERMTVPVPGEHKRLMMVTASWISLRQEGWPESTHSRIRRAMPRCRSSSVSSNNTDHRRSNTLPEISTAGLVSRPPVVQRMFTDGVVAGQAPEKPGLQRRLSAGAAFMRKRRLSLDLSEKPNFEMDAASTFTASTYAASTYTAPVPPTYPTTPKVATYEPYSTPLVPTEDKSNTCRLVVRRITQRIRRISISNRFGSK
ncbi:unnamed protein product [Clonostachys rosea f. rosea IK726]|uniref:Uncharacterized protein n=1 Tax=Clonostachys rosea f. rosea IK726 TaxID=1349383 RepID=A0ACA9T736_BIOOC|nr:unnamed protein product [Clonostachys rosea f. rosea IK726]